MNEDLIYLYRRKGYESWATCDADRYSELAGNHLFEVRVARHQHDYAALEAENARFQRAIVGMIDLAHEYRHLLTQQRFPDNDEGDAFRRHRDAQVARIERILSAAHAAKVKP